MAACVRNVLNRTGLLENHVSVLVTQVRGSRYNKTYQSPIIDKEKLQIPLDEEDPRWFNPIKAAPSSQSTVITYDPLVEKMTNMIMEKGKKVLARELIEQAFEEVKRKQIEKYHKASETEKASIEINPRVIFYQAVENCKPVLLLSKVKRGGITYQVPYACNPKLQTFRALKWIIESSRDKHRKIRFSAKLADEILDAYQNQGRSVRRKQEVHQQCEANKAYAGFKIG